MIETLYINDRGQITIPSKMRKALKIKDGDSLVVTKVDNKIVIQTFYTPGEGITALYNSVKVPRNRSSDPAVARKETRRVRAKKSVEDVSL